MDRKLSGYFRRTWLALVLLPAFILHMNSFQISPEERVHVPCPRRIRRKYCVRVRRALEDRDRSKAGGEESIRNLPWAREFDASIQRARSALSLFETGLRA